MWLTSLQSYHTQTRNQPPADNLTLFYINIYMYRRSEKKKRYGPNWECVIRGEMHPNARASVDSVIDNEDDGQLILDVRPISPTNPLNHAHYDQHSTTVGNAVPLRWRLKGRVGRCFFVCCFCFLVSFPEKWETFDGNCEFICWSPTVAP